MVFLFQLFSFFGTEDLTGGPCVFWTIGPHDPQMIVCVPKSYQSSIYIGKWLSKLHFK